jgi:hypothetical protein
MNLIITPVYKNFDVLFKMMNAIDKHSVYPFIHIIVDDNSGVEVPVATSVHRRVLQIRSDDQLKPHKSQSGQAIQLGYDYAHHRFWNGEEQPGRFENVFMIESDVVVDENWDKRMINLSKKLPENWGTLDCRSVDENGETTYPSTVSPTLRIEAELGCWVKEYPEFQCTLFNKKIFDLGIKFSDFPSHFDILFGRKTRELGQVEHYESIDISVLHIYGGGNSRGLL